MKIYIKNMVCNRCKIAVQSELERLGLHVVCVELGEAQLAQPMTQEQETVFKQRLNELGFEWLEDAKQRTIAQIKACIVALVHTQDSDTVVKLSTYISEHLLQEYGALSALFSEQEGQTIEKYFILQKTEKVKELLSYNELNLNQIAEKLHYSSVAHLSHQFKKVTGLTPTQFKQQNRSALRQGIDEL